MSEACQFCSSPKCSCDYCMGSGADDPLVSYQCGSERSKADGEWYQSAACKKIAQAQARIQELETELTAFKECFEKTNSACHELIKVNVSLQARIQELEGLVRKMGITLTGLLPTLIPRHQILVREILNPLVKSIMKAKP